MRTSQFVLLLFSGVSLAGCSQEQDIVAPETPETQQAVISDATWRMTGFLYEAKLKAGGPITTVNYFDRFGCERDDLYAFKADGKMTWDQNQLLCTGSNAKLVEWGTWQVTPASNQLILNHEGYNIFPHARGASSISPAFDIIELSDEKLVFRNNVSRAADSLITITYSFVKN